MVASWCDAGAEPKPVLRMVLHPSVGLEAKVIIPNPDRSARSMDFDAEGCGHGAPATESVEDATKASGGVALEQRLGWPLLRRAQAAAAAAAAVPAPSSKEQEPRKQSVVQWVMSLPRRTAPSESAGTHAGAGLASELKAMLDGGGARCRWFRYEELYDSTNHFSAGSSLHRQSGAFLPSHDSPPPRPPTPFSASSQRT